MQNDSTLLVLASTSSVWHIPCGKTWLVNCVHSLWDHSGAVPHAYETGKETRETADPLDLLPSRYMPYDSFVGAFAASSLPTIMVSFNAKKKGGHGADRAKPEQELSGVVAIFLRPPAAKIAHELSNQHKDRFYVCQARR